jgi:hypothetical protein
LGVRPFVSMGLVLALAGCALGPGVGSTRLPVNSGKLGTVPGLDASGAGFRGPGGLAGSRSPSITGSSVISNNGGSIISNNGGSLTGVVRLPASLLSENGAGLAFVPGSNIISDAGSSLVSSHGSKRSLLSMVSEAPVVGATVALLHATGQPVLGADGQARTAVTDGSGHYQFAGTPPGRNAVLSVALPGGKGTMQAIAPAHGQEAVPIDVISTLTTAYILERYVKPQAGSQDLEGVLDKLPSDVERATREQALAAQEAGTAPLPDALTSDKLLSAVEKLRQSASGFDKQLETVKKLLVVAGLSNLGAGRPGLEVALGRTGQLAIAPDGRLLITSFDEARTWSLGSDGRVLEVPGADGGTVIQAADGNTWLVGGRWTAGLHIDRLEKDGSLSPVLAAGRWPAGHRYSGGVGLPNGHLLIFSETEGPFQTVADDLAPDGNLVLQHTWTGPDASIFQLGPVSEIRC